MVESYIRYLRFAIFTKNHSLRQFLRQHSRSSWRSAGLCFPGVVCHLNLCHDTESNSMIIEVQIRFVTFGAAIAAAYGIALKRDIIVPARELSHQPSTLPSPSNNAMNMTELSSDGASKAPVTTPVFLLKTRSINDAYEEQLSAVKDCIQFEPVFVPVLEHKLLEEEMEYVRDLLMNKRIGEDSKYGGMIFTSQRAVEAFAKLVEEGRGSRYHRPTAAVSDSHR